MNEKQQLKVAWRYNNLLSDEKNVASGQSNGLTYKFDNSKEMGKSFANSMSHELKKEENTIFMKYDPETTNFIDLWE